MEIRFRKILAFALVLSVSVTCYLTVVQIVNAIRLEGLIESLDIWSQRGMNSTREFVIGDTVEFEAGCTLGSVYNLRIYHNSSLIFESDGEIHRSFFKAFAPLNPPAFGAGRWYAAVLDVYAFNTPILGAFYTDSITHIFGVLGTETKLKLVGTYDGVFRNLQLSSNLTDASDYSVPNEDIKFYSRPSSKIQPTDGWLLICSGLQLP